MERCRWDRIADARTWSFAGVTRESSPSVVATSPARQAGDHWFEPSIAHLENRHFERTSLIDPVIVDRFAVGVVVRSEGDELKALGAGLKGPRHRGRDAHCV